MIDHGNLHCLMAERVRSVMMSTLPNGVKFTFNTQQFNEIRFTTIALNLQLIEVFYQYCSNEQWISVTSNA